MRAVSTRRLAMFLGGTFLMGAGLVAAACGTDNGTTAVPTTDGGGGRDTSSSSSSSGSSGSEGGPTDAGPDCSNLPTPKSSDGPYCFSVADAAADGGTMSKNCSAAANEICCSGGRLPGDAGFEPSRCEVATEDQPNGGYKTNNVCQNFTTAVQQWHCMEAKHCPNQGEVCCAIASDAGSPKPGQDNDFPGCPVYFQSGRFTDGTRCEKTECKAGELTLCVTDADCKAGKCVPFTIAGRYGGYCRVQAN